MGLVALEELLRATMGLNAASIGSETIARAVRDRLSICELPDIHAYLQRVRESGTELQALIEAVVVPETWFFRDRHAFTALARRVREEWLPAHPEGVLSMLSLPCSSGEEPYSMAMALFDAGIPADRFRVDAVDISGHSLALARQAVYGKNSFRGTFLDFRNRYFDVTPDGYRVREAVRQQVRFTQGNLFTPDFLRGVGIYDVVFCRNVLIYFDRPMQDAAIGVINRLLRAKGVLFVAPAETALLAGYGLVSTKEPLAFAFRRVSARVPAAERHAERSITPPAPHRPAEASQKPDAQPKACAAGPATNLNEATRLADQGRFVEAAACCEEHLRRLGPSASAFYLMGLVRDATGNISEASAYYKKALYLDPNHYDTQVHLALLMEKQGDAAGAEILRNRARRLEQKSKTSHA